MTRNLAIGLGLAAVLVLVVVLLSSSSGRTTGASGEGWAAGSEVVLDERMAGFLDELAAYTGLPLYVTSGIRTAEAQARALLTKLELGETVQDLYDLYRRDDLIAELAEYPTTLEEWTAAIQEQVDAGELLSSHLSANALDLRTTGGGSGAYGQLSASQAAQVEAAAVELGARAVVESTPPHIHLNLQDYA